MHGHLNDPAHARPIHGDEALVVHEGEEAHYELAVHAVGDAAVAGNGFAEVLDLEGALEAGGEEAAEGGDERGEGGEDEDVKLHGRDGEGDGRLVQKEGEVDSVGLREEDWVGVAVEAGEDVGAKVLRVSEMGRWREYEADGLGVGLWGRVVRG